MPPKLYLMSLTALCWLNITAVSNAQGIRWKFSVGDEFVVSQQQTTSIDTLVEKRRSKIDSSVALLANWKVSEIDEDNTATIEQTIDSIKITINNPADNTKSVAIDSGGDSKPTKNSRDLLNQLKPLNGMTFDLKINDLGEVIEVSVPEETQRRLEEIPIDSWLKALLDAGKLQGQIQNTTLALPQQDLAEGQSINIAPPQNPATATAAPLGKRIMTYKGRRQMDGRPTDVFLLSTVEKFDAAKATPPSDPKLPEHPNVATFEWDGKMLFDRDAGHCVSCNQQTTIKTSRSYRDMEMSTTVIVDSEFTLQQK